MRFEPQKDFLLQSSAWLKCSTSTVQQQSPNAALVCYVSQTWHKHLQNLLILAKEGKYHSKEMQLHDQKKEIPAKF